MRTFTNVQALAAAWLAQTEPAAKCGNLTYESSETVQSVDRHGKVKVAVRRFADLGTMLVDSEDYTLKTTLPLIGEAWNLQSWTVPAPATPDDPANRRMFELQLDSAAPSALNGLLTQYGRYRTAFKLAPFSYRRQEAVHREVYKRYDEQIQSYWSTVTTHRFWDYRKSAGESMLKLVRECAEYNKHFGLNMLPSSIKSVSHGIRTEIQKLRPFVLRARTRTRVKLERFKWWEQLYADFRSPFGLDTTDCLSENQRAQLVPIRVTVDLTAATATNNQ